eukprot:scaffold9132_cov159-Ochromonas_danica.AAC.1
MHILLKITYFLVGLLVAQASPLWGALIVQLMGACLGVIVKDEGGGMEFASWVPHKKRNTYFVRL